MRESDNRYVQKNEFFFMKKRPETSDTDSGATEQIIVIKIKYKKVKS